MQKPTCSARNKHRHYHRVAFMCHVGAIMLLNTLTFNCHENFDVSSSIRFYGSMYL